MKYSVIFLFRPDLKEVQLQKKNRGKYVGLLNGVGGRIEETDADELSGAYRELFEETGIDRSQITPLKYLVCLKFPDGVELYVYYSVLDYKFNFTQKEDEILGWYDTDSTSDVRAEIFAGDGNTQYFIQQSIVNLKSDNSKLLASN